MKNTSLYMPIADERVQIVKVSFNGSAHYTYKSMIPLQADDVVVVEAKNWYGVATVVRTDVPLPIEDETTNFRWVVAKIDMHAHKRLLDAERTVIEDINARRVNNARGALLTMLGLDTDTARKLVTSVIDADDAVVEDDYNG